MTYVYPVLGKTGMGNMLFMWAEAFIYSRMNEATMIAPVWCRFSRVGPWLRRERYKRFYGGEITNQGYISGIKRFFLLSLPGINVRRFTNMDRFFDPLMGKHDVLLHESLHL